MNQLKPIYNSLFKDSYSHPIHTCFPIIASNEVWPMVVEIAQHKFHVWQMNLAVYRLYLMRRLSFVFPSLTKFYFLELSFKDETRSSAVNPYLLTYRHLHRIFRGEKFLQYPGVIDDPRSMV